MFWNQRYKNIGSLYNRLIQQNNFFYYENLRTMVHLSCTLCNTFNILWLRKITLVDWNNFCCKTLKCYSELRSTASLCFLIWIDNVYNYIKYKISKYICLILRCDGKILHFLFSICFILIISWSDIEIIIYLKHLATFHPFNFVSFEFIDIDIVEINEKNYF